jgi:hypothetical protein
MVASDSLTLYLEGADFKSPSEENVFFLLPGQMQGCTTIRFFLIDANVFVTHNPTNLHSMTYSKKVKQSRYRPELA